MAGRTLYEKIWASHTVGILPTGQTQLFIGLHLIHEITTAPAFDMLRENGMDVAFRDRDRKSTRLNSSHRTISYAVFCLKKKKKKKRKNKSKNITLNITIASTTIHLQS